MLISVTKNISFIGSLKTHEEYCKGCAFGETKLNIEEGYCKTGKLVSRGCVWVVPKSFSRPRANFNYTEFLESIFSSELLYCSDKIKESAYK